LQEKIAENQGLIDRISSIQQTLQGQAGGLLNVDDESLAAFSQLATSTYDQLIEAGFSKGQALKLISPLLKDLEGFAEAGELTIGPEIAELIEKANLVNPEFFAETIQAGAAEGVEILIDPMSRLADVIEALTGVIGVGSGVSMSDSRQISRMIAPSISLPSPVEFFPSNSILPSTPPASLISNEQGTGVHNEINIYYEKDTVAETDMIRMGQMINVAVSKNLGGAGTAVVNITKRSR
jgi:hypothetical protein